MSKTIGEHGGEFLDSANATASPGRKARRRRGNSFIRVVGPPCVVLACAIGIWYLISYVGLSPSQRFLLPPPHQVIEVGILNWQNFDEILTGLRSTATVALLAFIFSGLIGISFAILMSEGKWVERSFYPFAVALQTLPFLAIVPLIGFWFGFNFQSRVIVATIVSLFPITTNALLGLKSADPGHEDFFRLYQASRLTRLWRLKLPGALPSIFYGLRISAGLCVIASIVADFFIQSGTPGIGGLMDEYASRLQSEQLLTALATTAVVGIAVYFVISMIAQRVIGKWHSSYRESLGGE